MRSRIAAGIVVAVALAAAPARADTALSPVVIERSTERLSVQALFDRPRADEFAAITSTDFGESYRLRRIGRAGKGLGPGVDITPAVPAGRELQTFAIAYNRRRAEYLEVFGTGTNALSARRLTARGQPIEPPFAVTPPGAEPGAATLEYVPATGRYLLTWLTRADQYDYVLHARPLGARGRPIGPPRDPLGTYVGFSPFELAYNPRSHDFLATWEAKVGFHRGTNYARRIHADGRGAGRKHAIGGTRRHGSVAALAYSPEARAFVAIRSWAGSVPMHRQLLTPDGRRRGSERRVPAADGGKVYEEIPGELVPGRRELLLTWTLEDDRFHQGIFDYPRARRFDAAGGRGLAAPLKPAFAELPDAERGIGAVYSRRRDEYLIGWTAYGSGGWGAIVQVLRPAR